MPDAMVCCKNASIGLFFLLSLHFIGFAQSVTVRVLDAGNGHALPRQHVYISYLYEQQKAASSYNEHGITDADGKVKFTLAKDVPSSISVMVRLTSDHWSCGCLASVSTIDLLSKGVVESAAQSKSKTAVTARQAVPGEIVFLARAHTIFEDLIEALPFVQD